MSKFLTEKYASLSPYTPGEQPKDMRYIKLNTNESPFPPSRKAMDYAAGELDKLHLYSDPTCRALIEKLAEYYGREPENVIATNGSDEVLNFAFMAFCDKEHPALFADITYGFYEVFAELHGIPYKKIPLGDDFSINPDDYIGRDGTVFIANPNAPTGLALPLVEIERIVKSNPGRVVVVDEAYVDFGTESAVELTKKYDNLLVCATFSKSRSMAGARLGFGIGSSELIDDLNRLRYSTNPYNVNRMTLAAGVGSISDDEYFKSNCESIIATREKYMGELSALGFEMTASRANFIFARHPKIDGEELYLSLKESGILIRHFSKERIKDYNRITVGNNEQMQALIDKIKEIWGDKL